MALSAAQRPVGPGAGGTRYGARRIVPVGASLLGTAACRPVNMSGLPSGELSSGRFLAPGQSVMRRFGPGRRNGAGRFLYAGQQYLLLFAVRVDTTSGMSRDPFD